MSLRTRRQRIVWCRCCTSAVAMVVAGEHRRRRTVVVVLSFSRRRSRAASPGGRPCRYGIAAVTRTLLCHQAIVGGGRQVVAATVPCFLRLAGRRRQPAHAAASALGSSRFLPVTCHRSHRRTIRPQTLPRVLRSSPPQWMRAQRLRCFPALRTGTAILLP